ncbi:MAG: hypothetical protein P9X27_03530 [Candidatus Kaelpia aquatica]|nr:hypothetical protein [Candidatus Kaelpia aquatica]
MKRLKITAVIFITLLSSPLLLKTFLAEAGEAYPEWKIKLAYTLSAKGNDVKSQDPELAKEYYARAKKLYPFAAPKKEEIKVAKSIEPKKIIELKIEEKVEIKEASKGVDEKSDRSELITKVERKPLIKVSKKEEVRSLPKITKPAKKKYKAEEYSDYPEDAIIAEFISVDARKVYGAERLGPTINTILDPYYSKHKAFRIPYFKDREGLKIHPWIGVRGEYKYDEQRVGIESLMLEAQEFNQRRNDQVRDYISINKQEYYREEVILHIREWLPKFTFINHEETVKRVYKAKEIWSLNDTYYDNRNKRYYQMEYTIPRLKKLGYLKLKLRYGDELSYRTNDPAAYLPYESHLVGFETSPHISRLGRLKIKFEYEYWNGEYKQAENQGWSEREAWGRDYLLEFELYNQKKFLRITPHFSWGKEQHSPSHDTWWTKKTGLKVQRNINGKLSYTTDWTYIDYTRIKSPETASAQTVSASCWTWENEMEIELLRDFKLTVGLDYGNGLSFSAFDNITGRGELMLRKPGLIDLRFGYRYTDYFNVNDNVDTVYFKLGLFI